MSAKVPAEVTGVWRREQITAPGGYLDDTSQVFWVQSCSWYGDIRLGVDLPRRQNARGFADFTDAELLTLAEAQGFAGQLKVTPEMCAWRRDLDYQPRGPIPDEGTWAIEGDVLIEGGIHVEYEEIWRLEPGSQGLRAAFERFESRGLLILAGDHFLQIEARAAPLPDGGSLPALVSAALAAEDRALACTLLDMPICYGRIGEGWRIRHSTLPWREGQSLWSTPPQFSVEHGELTADDGAPWRLLELDDPVGQLAGLFAPAIGTTA